MILERVRGVREIGYRTCLVCRTLFLPRGQKFAVGWVLGCKYDKSIVMFVQLIFF